jgi:hypothetical protein
VHLTLEYWLGDILAGYCLRLRMDEQKIIISTFLHAISTLLPAPIPYILLLDSVFFFLRAPASPAANVGHQRYSTVRVPWSLTNGNSFT